MSKPCLNVALVGCPKTGKTTLTAAILAVLSHMRRVNTKQIEALDKRPDEIRLGMTVNGNQVEYDTDHYHVMLRDTPGEPQYVKNMILGLTGANAVIFVTDKKTLARREQAMQKKLPDPEGFFSCISSYVSPAPCITFFNLEGEFYGDSDLPETQEVIFGSAKHALETATSTYSSHAVLNAPEVQPILRLIHFLDGLDRTNDSENNNFCMSVTRVIRGKYVPTIAIGTVKSGTLRRWDDIVAVGPRKGYSFTVSSMEIDHQSISEARPGDSIAVELDELDADDVFDTRFSLVGKQEGAFPTRRLCHRAKLSCYLLSFNEGGRRRPFFYGFQPVFYFHAGGCIGTVAPIDMEIVRPGDIADIAVKFIWELPLAPGDRALLLSNGRIIGSAFVTELAD